MWQTEPWIYTHPLIQLIPLLLPGSRPVSFIFVFVFLGRDIRSESGVALCNFHFEDTSFGDINALFKCMKMINMYSIVCGRRYHELGRQVHTFKGNSFNVVSLVVVSSSAILPPIIQKKQCYVTVSLNNGAFHIMLSCLLYSRYILVTPRQKRKWPDHTSLHEFTKQLSPPSCNTVPANLGRRLVTECWT